MKYQVNYFFCLFSVDFAILTVLHLKLGSYNSLAYTLPSLTDVQLTCHHHHHHHHHLCHQDHHQLDLRRSEDIHIMIHNKLPLKSGFLHIKKITNLNYSFIHLLWILVCYLFYFKFWVY